MASARTQKIQGIEERLNIIFVQYIQYVQLKKNIIYDLKFELMFQRGH